MTNITCDANLFRLVYTIVSDELTRPYLCAVQIEPHKEGGVVLVATDGHRMLIAHDPGGRADAPALIQVTPAVLRASALSRKDTMKGSVRTLEVKGGNATVKDERGNVLSACDGVINPGVFPDWRRVTPQIPASGATLGYYAPAYVVDFCKVGAAIGAAAISFYSSEADGPALVRFFGPDYTQCSQVFGVLMPMTAGKKNGTTFPDFMAD